MTLLPLLLLLLFIFISISSSQPVLQTIFVDSTNGKDVNSCGSTTSTACASITGALSSASNNNSSIGLQLASGVYSGPLNCGLSAFGVASVQGNVSDRHGVRFQCAVWFASNKVSFVSFVNETNVASDSGGALLSVSFQNSSSLAVLDNATLVSVIDSSFEGDGDVGGTGVSVGASAALRIDSSSLVGFDVGIEAIGAARVSLRNVVVSESRRGVVLRAVRRVQAGLLTLARCRESSVELSDSDAVFSAGVVARDGAGLSLRNSSLHANVGLEIRRARSVDHAALLQIADGSRAFITGLLIANSTVGAAEVGVDVRGQSTGLLLIDSLITSISGPHALRVGNDATAQLLRVTIADNNATAIFTESALLDVTDSIIANNVGRRAGALEARVSSDVTLTDTRIFNCRYDLTLAKNLSQSAAGAILVHDSTVTLTHCALDLNGRDANSFVGTNAAQQIRCVAVSQDAATLIATANTRAIPLRQNSQEPDALCSGGCDWKIQSGSSIGKNIMNC